MYKSLIGDTPPPPLPANVDFETQLIRPVTQVLVNLIGIPPLPEGQHADALLSEAHNRILPLASAASRIHRGNQDDIRSDTMWRDHVEETLLKSPEDASFLASVFRDPQVMPYVDGYLASVPQSDAAVKGLRSAADIAYAFDVFAAMCERRVQAYRQSKINDSNGSPALPGR